MASLKRTWQIQLLPVKFFLVLLTCTSSFCTARLCRTPREAHPAKPGSILSHYITRLMTSQALLKVALIFKRDTEYSHHASPAVPASPATPRACSSLPNKAFGQHTALIPLKLLVSPALSSSLTARSTGMRLSDPSPTAQQVVMPGEGRGKGLDLPLQAAPSCQTRSSHLKRLPRLTAQHCNQVLNLLLFYLLSRALFTRHTTLPELQTYQHPWELKKKRGL